MIRLLQILMLALIMVIAIIHANKFARNEWIGPWWHLWWGFVYGLPAAIIALLCHSWWLAAAFAFERFISYNPILNYFRKPRMPFFYIAVTSVKPGFWDKIEIWWKGFYPYLWGVGVLIFIILQFLI